MALILCHDKADHSHKEVDAQHCSLKDQRDDHQDHVVHFSKAKDDQLFTVATKTTSLQKPVFLSQVILPLRFLVGFHISKMREHPSPVLNPTLVSLRTTVLVI